MTKTIIIKLKKAGSTTSVFSISDDSGNLLAENIHKNELIDGLAITINNTVKNLILSYSGTNCCNKTKVIPITTTTYQELAATKFEAVNTSSMWKHLDDPTIYNIFYGCIAPYIIEHPFGYQVHDQILQGVKDNTRAFVYLSGEDRKFDETRKVQVDNRYFNKAVLYNDQQSSGILELYPKPQNNLKEYLSYPKYHNFSKSILYTKSDNIYHYNTFWSVVKDPLLPLFTKNCTSLSIDKEVNQSNMNYLNKSFRKEPLRAKYLKVRHILDNASDLHLTSQFIITPSQISYN